jgi:hypothetical protein
MADKLVDCSNVISVFQYGQRELVLAVSVQNAPVSWQFGKISGVRMRRQPVLLFSAAIIKQIPPWGELCKKEKTGGSGQQAEGHFARMEAGGALSLRLRSRLEAEARRARNED